MSYLFATVMLAIVLTILVFVPSAYALTPLEASTMQADVRIDNTVLFLADGGRSDVEEASGTLYWYPRETWSQQVVDISTVPAATFAGDAFLFSWQRPSQSERITLTAGVQTSAAVVPVRSRVAFPIGRVPADIAQYLAPYEITDTSPQLRSLAQELARDKTDAYEVVFALADWTTTNVDYSLASVGQPAVQRSSAVLESRYGKCDELTALFISLCRSLGIPARFVGGYAYTNSDRFDTPWGGHGWAEVWLPEQGWVPFDVTYGQYGYLDAGHVPMRFAPDAQESSVDYTARGNGFSLRTQSLDIDVVPAVLTERSPDDDDVAVTTTTAHDAVGFGSAVLVVATVQNRRDYYVSSRVDLVPTRDTQNLSATTLRVLLRPRAAVTIPFLIQIDETQQHGLRYEFPFTVAADRGDESMVLVTVREDLPRYDASSYAQAFERLRPAERLPAAFDVTCVASGANYTGLPVRQECSIIDDDRRGGTAGITRISVCSQARDPTALDTMIRDGAAHETQCEWRTVTDGKFFIETVDDRPGVFAQRLTAQLDDGQSTQFFVTSRTVAPATVQVGLDAPQRVQPDETMTVSLSLNGSGSTARNLTVELFIRTSTSSQKVESLDRPANIAFSVPARLLRPGMNVVRARVSYVDEFGTPGEREADVTIELVEVSIIDRLGFWSEDAWSWIASFAT